MTIVQNKEPTFGVTKITLNAGPAKGRHSKEWGAGGGHVAKQPEPLWRAQSSSLEESSDPSKDSTADAAAKKALYVPPGLALDSRRTGSHAPGQAHGQQAQGWSSAGGGVEQLYRSTTDAHGATATTSNYQYHSTNVDADENWRSPKDPKPSWLTGTGVGGERPMAGRRTLHEEAKKEEAARAKKGEKYVPGFFKAEAERRAEEAEKEAAAAQQEKEERERAKLAEMQLLLNKTEEEKREELLLANQREAEKYQRVAEALSGWGSASSSNQKPNQYAGAGAAAGGSEHDRRGSEQPPDSDDTDYSERMAEWEERQKLEPPSESPPPPPEGHTISGGSSVRGGRDGKPGFGIINHADGGTTPKPPNYSRTAAPSPPPERDVPLPPQPRDVEQEFLQRAGQSPQRTPGLYDNIADRYDIGAYDSPAGSPPVEAGVEETGVVQGGEMDPESFVQPTVRGLEKVLCGRWLFLYF